MIVEAWKLCTLQLAMFPANTLSALIIMWVPLFTAGAWAPCISWVLCFLQSLSFFRCVSYRYYLQNGLAVVKMVDATFEYTYEYQGNAPKLVHTHLTDKCFISLTQGQLYLLIGSSKPEAVFSFCNFFGFIMVSYWFWNWAAYLVDFV